MSADESEAFEPAPDWNPDRDPLLDIRDLSLSFRVYEGISEVLSGVSLSVMRGETVSLVGESGCGKSVTSRAILGILDSNAIVEHGEVIYKGRDMLDLSEAELAAIRGTEIALIPQDPMTSLNPIFTVEEQLVDLLYCQGGERDSLLRYFADKLWGARDERRELRSRIRDMLEKLGIDDPGRVMGSYPLELSGGMRQRVLIAAALLGEPEFVIADEIGTALDVTVEDQMLTLLRDRIDDEDLSVLYITHDLGVARDISQRLYVMYAGVVMETATASALFDQPRHPYTAGLIGSVPKLGGQIPRGIDGMIPDYVDPPEGCRFHTRCPFAMPSCSRDRPPLAVPGTSGRTPTETNDRGGHRVACHLYDERYADEHPDGWQRRLADIVGVPRRVEPADNVPERSHEGESTR